MKMRLAIGLLVLLIVAWPLGCSQPKSTGIASAPPIPGRTAPALPEAAADQVPLDLALAEASPVTQTVYTLSPAELARIRESIGVMQSISNAPDASVRYSEDFTWMDGWLPMPGTLVKVPPQGDHYTWIYSRGRVADVYVTLGGRTRLARHVWSNSAGAPILVMELHETTSIYHWADYDKAGLLRRVVRLSAEFKPLDIAVFFNTPGYASTIHDQFTPAGRLYVRTRNEGDAVFVMDMQTGDEKCVNSGTRRFWIDRLKQYGLASLYPVPGDDDDPLAPLARFDPKRVRLQIARIEVDPATVEKQCTGKITIRNVGRGYPAATDIILPYWMLSIYDANDKILFQAGGGWTGGMAHDEQLIMSFDTHSNTLRGTGGKPFLFPEPGQYRVTMEVIPGGDLKESVDSQSVRVTVPAVP